MKTERLRGRLRGASRFHHRCRHGSRAGLGVAVRLRAGGPASTGRV